MKNTKRIISLLISLVILLLPVINLSACASEDTNVTTLYVYNWGEYISDGSDDTVNVNEEFERWYFDTYGKRVKVNYSTYSSNEDLYAKISSEAVRYDVIVPSDYMVQRLWQEGYLAELNYDNIPNIENILPDFLGENAYYDKGNVYSVPYLYGMIGIIYNTSILENGPEPDIGSWELMWNEKYSGNILQFNNSRDAFGTALYKLGYDVNSATEEQWREALDLLKSQKKIVQGYVMDEIYNKMENESALIAAYYAGDYLAMYENNPNLEFYYPKEGTNLYVDAMCVPKSSQNKDIAEAYINFMLGVDEEYGAPAIANAEYTYYASPNKLVVENEGYIEYMSEIKDDAYEKMYQRDGVEVISSYENLSEEKLVFINGLWEELKADIDIGLWIYVVCGIIVLLLILMWIFYRIKKKAMQRLYEAS